MVPFIIIASLVQGMGFSFFALGNFGLVTKRQFQFYPRVSYCQQQKTRLS